MALQEDTYSLSAKMLVQFQLEIALIEKKFSLCRILFIRQYMGNLEEFYLHKCGNIGFMASKISWGEKYGKLLSAMGK